MGTTLVAIRLEVTFADLQAGCYTSSNNVTGVV